MDIDDVLLRVYRARLDAESNGAADRQAAKDADGGAKQRRRAECYRAIVTETLVQAGVYVRPVRERPARKSVMADT